MTLFDSLLDEADAKFKLGDQASSLLTALLALITDAERGGLPGFLNLFERAGLGTVTESWISRGENTSLSNQQLEDALGANTIRNISQRVGLSLETATSALAFLIPQVVDRLTPDGIVAENTNLISTIGSYLTETSTAAKAGSAIAPAGETIVESAADNSWLRWVLPLILLAVLGGIFYYTFLRPNQPTRLAAPINAATSTNSPRSSTQNLNGSH